MTDFLAFRDMEVWMNCSNVFVAVVWLTSVGCFVNAVVRIVRFVGLEDDRND